jgi:class 3 adenylate cyclase
MHERFARNFGSPDETIEAEGVVSDHVDLKGMTVARDTHQPGWRWSVHVRPLVGGDWCETRHLGYVLRGQLRVVMREGVEFDLREGDVFDLPSGHDAWVVGDDVFETLSWMGARTWLMPLLSLKERVLATLVFTDVVDSTGAARRLGDRAWADLLSTHNQRIADIVDHFQGRLVDRTGDGMLAVFDGAARAIRCALECDSAVIDLGLRLRAAVHTGDIEVAGDEIHGMVVHEAARMLELAGAGDVLVSSGTVDLARDAGLSFEDRGEHELRGVGASSRLLAVVRDK